jgi:hypothetical protein
VRNAVGYTQQSSTNRQALTATRAHPREDTLGIPLQEWSLPQRRQFGTFALIRLNNKLLLSCKICVILQPEFTLLPQDESTEDFSTGELVDVSGQHHLASRFHLTLLHSQTVNFKILRGLDLVDAGFA